MKRSRRPTRSELLARIDQLERRIAALERDPTPPWDDASLLVERALGRATARARGSLRLRNGAIAAQVKARILAQVAAEKALGRAARLRKKRKSTDARRLAPDPER